MNRENSSEKRTFDIGTAFYNQMVNLIRNETEKVRIVLIGNTLEEASDIMCLFNFIPEEFGRYKLRKKKAVIDYIPPSEKYLEKNEKGVLGILASESSSFTNKIEIDTTLIDKSRLIKPIYCIKFKDAKFTVWDDGIVAKWNGEMVRVVPMAPYLDEVFSVELRDEVYQIYHNRRYRFRNLITQKEFKKELALLKGRG